MSREIKVEVTGILVGLEVKVSIGEYGDGKFKEFYCCYEGRTFLGNISNHVEVGALSLVSCPNIVTFWCVC